MEAKDRDGNPYRVLSQQNESLRNIASKHGVPLIDAQRLLVSNSANGLLGFNLMIDNCHPNLRGYVLLGHEIARRLSEIFDVPVKLLPEDIGSIKKAFGFDAHAEYLVYLSRADFFLRMATLTTMPSFRLNRAKYYLDVASKLDTDAHLNSSYALVYAYMNRDSMAELYWQKAQAIDASDTRKRWNNIRVVQIMSRTPELREVAARLDRLFTR